MPETISGYRTTGSSKRLDDGTELHELQPICDRQNGGSEIGEDTWVGVSAILQNRIRIGSGCYIYPEVGIGSGVVISSGTCIKGGVVIGYQSQIGRGVEIDDEVILGSHVRIFDKCKIGRASRIEENADVAAEVIGQDCQIGRGTTIGVRCSLGHFVKIGNECEIYRDSVIGEGSIICASSRIEHGVTIGKHVMIGNMTYLDTACNIGNYVTTGAYVHIGDNAFIKDDTLIPPGLTIGNEAAIRERSDFFAAGPIGTPQGYASVWRHERGGYKISIGDMHVGWLDDFEAWIESTAPKNAQELLLFYKMARQIVG